MPSLEDYFVCHTRLKVCTTCPTVEYIEWPPKICVLLGLT